MDCPKCNKLLRGITFGEIEIDQCTGCGGLWFDLGEAEQLSNGWIAEYIDTGDVKLGEKMDGVLASGCPRCGNKMRAYMDIDKSHVFYEACEAHGKFFDAGEFTLWANNQYL